MNLDARFTLPSHIDAFSVHARLRTKTLGSKIDLKWFIAIKKCGGFLKIIFLI